MRARASLLLLAVIALAGCQREERNYRADPVATESVEKVALAPLSPGPSGPVTETSGKAKEYENNAYHLSQGKTLYKWMNCVGCHANGGGGMGPPLMDEEWRYGGRIDQIAATIVNGRPNGMPSFRNNLTPDQVWQLAAYVRTLSGQTRKDAIGGRVDAVSSIPPPSERIEEPVVPANRLAE